MTVRLTVVEPRAIPWLGLAGFCEGSDVLPRRGPSTPIELLAELQRGATDLLLISMQPCAELGLEMLSAVRQADPSLPALLIGDNQHPILFARAYESGASGFLPMAIGRDDFLDSIAKVVAGQALWSRTDVRRITGIGTVANHVFDGEVALTAREIDILKGMAQGWTNRKIAEHFGISPETVKEHVQHCLRKLAVQDRTQASVWAVRRGLV